MTGVLSSLRPVPGVADLDAPVTSTRELRAFFEGGCKPPSTPRRVGVEVELLPLLESGAAAPYSADGPCVERLLARLATLTRLAPTEVDGRILGLHGADRAVHLEPGAQVELALGPRERASEVLADLQAWRAAARQAAEAEGVRLAAIGLQPVTPVRDIPWVPKERYPIMRDHLAARGDLAHHMMKATASIQVSVDYRSEAEAGDILATALAVSPLVNAMVVNAPLEEGRPHGLLSRRPEIWSRTDPDRCGLLPWALDEPWTFDRWVEWTLGVPVMFVLREGRHVRLDGRTFGEYLASPGAGGQATHADYQVHLTTLFPEVRLKQHVEIRGMDTGSAETAAALAATWMGLLADASTRREARALAQGQAAAARRRLHHDVGRSGLAAPLGGGRVRDVLPALLELAGRQLPHDDRALLAPLAGIVEAGQTPAETLLADWAVRGAEALVARA